jgi:hypothetical protein
MRRKGEREKHVKKRKSICEGKENSICEEHEKNAKCVDV